MASLTDTLPRGQLRLALVASAFLAIPTVSFISALVVFPLLVYALFGIIACYAPLFALAARALDPHQSLVSHQRIQQVWLFYGIIWIGCAYGLSRWGDAASSMGGKNEPYLKVLFAPVLLPLQWLLG